MLRFDFFQIRYLRGASERDPRLDLAATQLDLDNNKASPHAAEGPALNRYPQFYKAVQDEKQNNKLAGNASKVLPVYKTYVNDFAAKVDQIEVNKMWNTVNSIKQKYDKLNNQLTNEKVFNEEEWIEFDQVQQTWQKLATSGKLIRRYTWSNLLDVVTGQFWLLQGYDVTNLINQLIPDLLRQQLSKVDRSVPFSEKLSKMWEYTGPKTFSNPTGYFPQLQTLTLMDQNKLHTFSARPIPHFRQRGYNDRVSVLNWKGSKLLSQDSAQIAQRLSEKYEGKNKNNLRQNNSDDETAMLQLLFEFEYFSDVVVESLTEKDKIEEMAILAQKQHWSCYPEKNEDSFHSCREITVPQKYEELKSNPRAYTLGELKYPSPSLNMNRTHTCDENEHTKYLREICQKRPLRIFAHTRAGVTMWRDWVMRNSCFDPDTDCLYAKNQHTEEEWKALSPQQKHDLQFQMSYVEATEGDNAFTHGGGGFWRVTPYNAHKERAGNVMAFDEGADEEKMVNTENVSLGEWGKVQGGNWDVFLYSNQ